MKKILFFGALVAMLLGTAACSSDMEPSMGDDSCRVTSTAVLSAMVRQPTS